MNNDNNNRYNHNAPPDYYEENNLINHYTNSNNNNSVPTSNTSSLYPTLPPRSSPLTSQQTGTNSLRPISSHNPFLQPGNASTSSHFSNSNTLNTSNRPSASPYQPSAPLNHSHSAPYLNSNVTGSSRNSFQSSNGNSFNSEPSPYSSREGGRASSSNSSSRIETGGREGSSYNNTNAVDGRRREHGLPSVAFEDTKFEYEGGMRGMTLFSNYATDSTTSTSTPPPSTPFKSTPNVSNTNFIPSTTNSTSPLPALPTSSLSHFASSLNSIIDNSFTRLDEFFESQLAKDQKSSTISRSTGGSSNIQSTFSTSEESDSMTSAFLTSFPSLDDQSPVLQPASLSPHLTGSSSSIRGGESTVSLLSMRENLKQEIASIVRDEFRRRDQILRVELEKEVEKLKESNLQSMKNLLSLTQERDQLTESNETLVTELSNSQMNFSLDLNAAVNQSSLLQERIDILQIALNEDTSDGNHSRQDSSREVEEQGDSIWSTIVDEREKALSLHTVSLATLLPSLTCSICSEVYSEPITLKCGHTGCKACLEDWMMTRGNRSCPDCREVFVEGIGVAKVSYSMREVVKVLKGVGLGEEERD